MCLIVRFETEDAAKEYRDNPLIAKEDIKVYKLLCEHSDSGDLYSPYFSQLYVESNRYKSEIHFTISFLISDLFDTIDAKYGIFIDEALHSFKSLDATKEFLFVWGMEIPGAKIFKMTIPKGSKYYVDEINGEVASDTLLFTNKTN